jgi:GAG-pre-integrase domain
LHTTQQSNLSVTRKTPLTNHISGEKGPKLYCANCKKDNHTTDKCRHLGKALCTICNCFRHKTSDCYNNENRDRDNKKKRNTHDNYKSGKDTDNRPSKKGKYKQTSQVAEAEDEEMSTILIEQNMIPSNYEEDEYGLIEPFEYENVNYAENNNMIRDCYIECLANSGTTSHVFNKRAMFTDYCPLNDIYVGGVGGTKTRAHGKGTIRVLAEMKSGKCIIKLNDVLHVPECKHNLISLGRWEDNGRSYRAQNGTLTLYTSKDNPVIQGERSQNNLYWLKLHITQQDEHLAFNATKITWDTWHHRFGHIGYSGLQKLREKNLVSRFTPELRSPKPDCGPCTQAKLAHKPFPSTAMRTNTIGILTHIDLWGKYQIQSIHGNQYYILFVDDYTRYVTVQFLKGKNQAVQHI